MAHNAYTPLPQIDNVRNDKHSRKRSNCLIPTLVSLLIASMSANIWFVQQQFVKPWDLADRLPTKFAHLRRNITTQILAESSFDSTNRTIQDEAWDHPDLEPWNNFVALKEDYTIEKGLPHSQRWPWDHGKGAYILTSAHELHCVRVLRSSVNENHDGVSEADQTWPYAHLIHCLNVLRESVMCNADDTPLYTGHVNGNVNSTHPRAGIGSMKMCRDWHALLRWSRERSACYRPVPWTGDFPELERYKFCPNGERPWEQMEHSS